MTEQLPPPHVTSTTHRSPRILAITAFATGIAAVLTAAVAIAYVPVMVFAGVALGLVAVALGVAALLAKHRPVAASITGTTAGAIALVASLLIVVLQVSAPSPTVTQLSSEHTGIETVWPLNMASGGAVFGEGMLPIETEQLEPGSSPEPHQSDRGTDPVDIMLYVDYRCPHCSVFEMTHAATLEEAVESGQATLEIRPLTFMDRNSAGSAYSSRAANLFACTVQEQPENAWKIHNMLLHPEIQPTDQGSGRDDVFLLAAADIAVGGEGDPSDSESPLTPGLQSCVIGGDFIPFAQAINEWTFANPVPRATDPTLRVEGTPLVVVSGNVFNGDGQNSQAFKLFLEQQGVIFE